MNIDTSFVRRCSDYDQAADHLVLMQIKLEECQRDLDDDLKVLERVKKAIERGASKLAVAKAHYQEAQEVLSPMCLTIDADQDKLKNYKKLMALVNTFAHDEKVKKEWRVVK